MWQTAQECVCEGLGIYEDRLLQQKMHELDKISLNFLLHKSGIFEICCLNV